MAHKHSENNISQIWKALELMSNNKLPQINAIYSDSSNNDTAVRPQAILNIGPQYLSGNFHSPDTSTLLDIKYPRDLLDRKKPNDIRLHGEITPDTYLHQSNRSPITTYIHQAKENTEHAPNNKMGVKFALLSHREK